MNIRKVAVEHDTGNGVSVVATGHQTLIESVVIMDGQSANAEHFHVLGDGDGVSAMSVEAVPSLATNRTRAIADRVIAGLIVGIIAPMMLLRAAVARAQTGRVFDRQSALLPCRRATRIADSQDARSFEVYRFAGTWRGRRLAMLLNIVAGDLAFVGPSVLLRDSTRNNPNQGLYRVNPGLISVHQLRRMTGTDYQQVVSPAAYPDHTLAESLGIMARYIVARQLSADGALSRPDQFTILGVNVLNTTMQGALDRIGGAINTREKTRIAFVNPACLNEATTNPEYNRILEDQGFVLPDGIGLLIGSRMLGVQMKANVNGTDLFPLLCERCVKHQWSIYLLGGQPGVAEAAAATMVNRYPGLDFKGTRDGFFQADDEDSVIEDINASGADILLVAFGVPKQEQWIDQHHERLRPLIQMGVGGLLDFYSGRISRSPRWMQDVGLEWVWRLMQEPSRMWRRYILGNPVFLFRVFRQARSNSVSRVVRRFAKGEGARKTFGVRYRLRHLAWNVLVKLTYVCKRLTDIVGASVALLLLSPLCLVVIAAIKLESPGPVFFSQQRVGRWGTFFKMYKFRSMYVDAEARKAELLKTNEMAGGVIFKMKSDPRITRVGTFIRKYSIDELPQLLNVLCGDMSLVGPRPPLPSEVNEYSIEDRRRLEVVPGITCIWQVSGRSEIPFDQQVQLDVEYIESQSFFQDIKILLKTIPAVLMGKGAY